MSNYLTPAMRLYLERLVDWEGLLSLRRGGPVDREAELGAFRTILETAGALAAEFERPAREGWFAEAELTADGGARPPAHIRAAYEKLKEMDEVNSTMDTVDVALVIGANDVVNPVARTDPNSPIAGMPIIDVDKARTVVVIKRSLSPGFAGIPNPLFADDKTLMFFNDGKKAFLELIQAVKES